MYFFGKEGMFERGNILLYIDFNNFLLIVIIIY